MPTGKTNGRTLVPREFVDYLNESGLSPVESVHEVETPGDLPNAVRVVLDPTSPDEVTRSLARWVDLLIVYDATVGTYDDNDPFVRFNLRGEFASGLKVVVVAPFRRESERARYAELKIEELDPTELVEDLDRLSRSSGS